MTEKHHQSTRDSIYKGMKVLATFLAIGTVMVAMLTYVIESHEMAARCEMELSQKADKRDIDELREELKELKDRQDELRDRQNKTYDTMFGNDVTVRHFKQKNNVRRYSDTPN